jgi:hypothetical protein
MLADGRHSVDIVACVVEYVGVGVEIKSVPIVIGKNKIAFPSPIEGGLGIRELLTTLASRHVLVGQRDIEIVVNPSLSPQQSVYGPTSINVDCYAGLLQESNQVCSSTRIH